MATPSAEYRQMSGPEKAAIIMLSLGEEAAASLFVLMDEEEIREISQSMSRLGTIRAETVEWLFVDFTDQMSTHGTLLGSMESTERLLKNVLDPDTVDTIMEDIRGPAGRTMWDKLCNVSEVLLANYLKNEYPQTVAVVMSKITPDHAARVLAILPEPFALEVISRMLGMEVVQKEVLNDVEKTLRNEFMSNLARTNRRDSHELMAEIFNYFDRNTEGRVMTALEERNNESAEKIKTLMFTFEDLARLDSAGVQTLLRVVDQNKLALALKGASKGYAGLGAVYQHQPTVQGQGKNAETQMPIIHVLFSNLKTWLNGTDHGVSAKHLPRYGREWAYRFNRRRRIDDLGDFVLSRAMARPTITYRQLIHGLQPQGARPALTG